MEDSSSDFTTSNSYSEKHTVKKTSFFRRSHPKNMHSGSSPCNDMVNNAETQRDLTPGSLEIWLDLPDEIKYDPALAPFRRLYEQHHGKLDTSSVSSLNGKLPELLPIGEINDNNERLHRISGTRLMRDHEDYAKTKSTNKKKLEETLRIVKLAALVGCWALLTVSLLLNREKTDVVLNTAVHGGTVKEYHLEPSDGRVTLLAKLTGPFAESSRNASMDSDTLYLWLSRGFRIGDSEIVQQNSSFWAIQLQPPEAIDFSQSVSESKTLVLEDSGFYFTEASKNGSGTVGNLNGGNASEVTLRMHTDSESTVPLTIVYQLNPLSEEDGIIYATVLLCVLYVLIIFEIVNRTLAALLMSSLGVATLAFSGVRPSLPELVSWLDVETLLLLFSMMLLVAILADTGLFDYLAVLAFEAAGGKTWPLINCLCLFTALFSTFLDNVTTVLLMTPVTIRLCEVMQLNPVPVLMSMVIFSNVGGAATPVGDPPNVIIASHPAVIRENINFTTFTLHMGVGILLVGVQTYAQLRFMFRDIRKLRHSVPSDIQEMRQEIQVWRRAAGSLSSYARDEDIVRKALEKKVEKLTLALLKKESGQDPSRSDPKFCSTLAQMKEKYKIRDTPLLIKSAICVSFVVTVFFLHAIPELQRLSLGWTALLGALLLLLLAEKEDLEPVLARVEWSTLLFFAALFVLMEVLSKLGLISWIGKVTEEVILKVGEESRLAVAIMLILWVSGIASAFVDNIPLTTMMVRVIAALADPGGLALPLAPLAWALSFGACLGGNGTLIGASANVVCAGVAEQHGYRFTFLQFLKIGFPIMIGNLLVSSVYLLFCHCVLTLH